MDVATAIFATSAAVVSSANLQGSLGEVQSIVMLASHRCAAPAAVACLDLMDWALTPVRYGPDEAPGLYGSFTVTAGFFLLHALLCCVVKLAQGRMSDTLTNQERWDIAAAKTLYPNLSLIVLAFFYQGIILRTFQNYFAGKHGGYGMGISFVTGAFSLALAGLLVWWSLSKGHHCEFQPLGNYRRLRRRTWFEQKLLIPDGTYTTLPYLFRMGVVLFPYRPSRTWFNVVPWIRMFLLGFLAAALDSSCDTMYALAAVVFGINFILALVLRPCRFGLGFVCSVLMQLVSLMTCVVGLGKVALPCPMYMAFFAVSTAVATVLAVVGLHEQRSYRPEAEALEQRQSVQNPLLSYL
jgi:hypothetical protein